MNESFLDILIQTDFKMLLSKGENLDWARVSTKLSSEEMSITEFAALIADASDDHLEELAQAAKYIRAKRFGNAIKLYAPLYLSNRCINGCMYCGFNKSNEIQRSTLTIDETIAEATELIDQGHRHLLLVAGEDDETLPLSHVEKIAQLIRPRVASLSIELRPMNVDEYSRLSHAGIDGVTLYQETYQTEEYRNVHKSGPKTSFENRIRSIESAGTSGMRFLGIGALLGLADWRLDTLATMLHAKYLQKKFWQSNITISVPRLRSVPNDFQVPQPVNDRNLVRIIASLRCALPEVGIVVSTREPSHLRNNIVSIGVTQMSAGSRTEPGGYTNPHESGEQFAIDDSRSTNTIAESLKASGFDPVFKDWESCLYGT